MKDLQELKNTISVIEVADKNIDNWNKLKDRELCIIPVDSNYYKEFSEWKKSKGAIYDGEINKSPMYILNKEANEVLDLLIKHQEDFVKPYKEKLSIIITTH